MANGQSPREALKLGHSAPRSLTLVLDVLDARFSERYHAARSQGASVIINPFDLVYRLGWDANQAFLLKTLEEVCADIELPKLRDEDGFDLFGRYLLDAAYGAIRRGRGKGAVLEPSTVDWFVERGCSLQTRYTDHQVLSYQDQLIGRVFQSDDETGLSACCIIESSEPSALPDAHPWLQTLRAHSADSHLNDALSRRHAPCESGTYLTVSGD